LKCRQEQRPKPEQKASATRRPQSGRTAGMMIAQVDTVRAGSKGGYYNCTLQKFDATDWDSTTANQTNDIGASVVVLNMSEVPVTSDTGDQNLSAGDYILCWRFTDDEGNARYIGIAALRYTSC